MKEKNRNKFFSWVKQREKGLVIFSTLVYLALLVKFSNSYFYNPLYLFSLFLLYFAFIYLVNKKSRVNVNVPILTISIVYLSLLILRFFLYGHTPFKIHNYLFLFVLVIFHFLVVYAWRKKSALLVIIHVVFNFIVCFYLHFFIDNYLTFGTYLGGYDYSIQKDLVIHDAYEEAKNMDEDKIYVFDVWNRGCGVCFIKFPKFEKLKKKYETSEKVEFAALNLYRDDEDLQSVQNLFDQRKLSLNNLFIHNSYSEDLQTYFFPTVIVVKNNKIIFRGHVETLNALHFLYLK